MESFALFTQSRAERYGVFLPRWWKAISRLDRQPDQIVIVHHESNLARVPESVPAEYASRVKLVSTPVEDGNAYGNLCVTAADTDWVAFCGLDDQVLPNGYDELVECGSAEIMVGGIRLSSGSEVRGVWDVEQLKRTNVMVAHSPFRKSLWERVGRGPEIYWSDWGFWAKCAMAEATTFRAQNVQVLFDLGESHETESGVLLPQQKRLEATEEFFVFAREIGFVDD